MTRAPAPLSARIGVYACGVLLVGIGIAAMVRARIGVSPNDVLNTGLADVVGIGVGTASWIVGGVAVLLSWALGRPPRPATLIGGVVVGLTLNAMLGVVSEPSALAVRVPLFVVGICSIWAGITAAVAADLGAGPMELIMLGLIDRGWGIRPVRWGLEATLLVLGLLLGGDAHVGTAVFAFGTGPALAMALPPACRWMGTALAHPVPAPAEPQRSNSG